MQPLNLCRVSEISSRTFGSCILSFCSPCSEMRVSGEVPSAAPVSCLLLISLGRFHKRNLESDPIVSLYLGACRKNTEDLGERRTRPRATKDCRSISIQCPLLRCRVTPHGLVLQTSSEARSLFPRPVTCSYKIHGVIGILWEVNSDLARI